ncbi:MAG: phosphoribosylformylglycinamidine synthase I [Verrucomicrobiales bacterium]|nr:phosphoribosylformylglycinamidine synthase I [Verrucomicrobiales bacterium]
MFIQNPRAILLKYPGTNADEETARSLSGVGFAVETIPISQAAPHHFADTKLVVFPGGFSYGDYVMAGRVAQLVTQQNLPGVLNNFVSAGGHVLGICNGFQILTKLGLLPAGSLIDNTSGRFQCRWVAMRVLNPQNPFLQELPEECEIEMPIAHAEGRFVAPEGMAENYLQEGLVPLAYTEDVNGSSANIAALQDVSGRVFGLMPHPERFFFRRHHYDPDWAGDPLHGWGYYFFHSIWLECSGSRRLLASNQPN